MTNSTPKPDEQLNAEALIWLLAEVLKEHVSSEDDGSFSQSLSEIASYNEESSDDAFAALTYTNGILAIAAYRPSTLKIYIAARVLKVLIEETDSSLVSEQVCKELTGEKEQFSLFCVQDYLGIQANAGEQLKPLVNITDYLSPEIHERHPDEIEHLMEVLERANTYFQSRLAERVYRVITQLLEEAFFTEWQSEFPTDQVKIWQEFLTEGIRKRGRGRKPEWFLSKSDFLEALKEVIQAFKRRPTQLKVLQSLDAHRLCNNKHVKLTQSDTSLLRTWIKKAEIADFDDAIEQFWEPNQKRK